MRVDNLAVALFYEHPDVGTWSLWDLVRHRGVIAPDDLTSERFYDAAGSIRLYSDRFMCFLATGAAGELRNYVNFLIESLISLTDRALAREFPETSAGSPFLDTGETVAGLFQEDQTRIVLQDAGTLVSISFENQDGEAPGDRLSPYFRDVTVDKAAWKRAAIEALDEYFGVAAERTAPRDQGRLHDLVVRWRSQRPKFAAGPFDPRVKR